MPDSARLLRLLCILQEGPASNAQALAARCSVSLRTIHRDLDRLLRLGYPIRFDAGYRLVGPDLMPPLQLTAEEALAARLALASRKEPAAGSASAKLAALAHLATLSPPPTAGAQLPLDLPPVSDPAETARLTDLHRAVCERRAVRLREGRGRRAGREIVLEPSRVLFARGHWWAVGYAPARRRLIAVATDRLQAVTLTGRRFREREGVRPERLLARLGPEAAMAFAATLRLGPSAAPLAAGLPTHWLTRLERGADGSARLSVATPHPEQLLAWVTTLGESAEVLEPPALRAELARRGQLLVRRYGQAQGR